jgi:hypothetical protein
VTRLWEFLLPLEHSSVIVTIVVVVIAIAGVAVVCCCCCCKDDASVGDAGVVIALAFSWRPCLGRMLLCLLSLLLWNPDTIMSPGYGRYQFRRVPTVLHGNATIVP